MSRKWFELLGLPAAISDSTRALKPFLASDMSSVRTSCQLEKSAGEMLTDVCESCVQKNSRGGVGRVGGVGLSVKLERPKLTSRTLICDSTCCLTCEARKRVEVSRKKYAGQGGGTSLNGMLGAMGRIVS